MNEEIEQAKLKEKRKFFIAAFFEWIGFDEETVAGFFNFLHSAVDLADMPIRRTVMVLQPVIAPLVPAAFIRSSLVNHMGVTAFVANSAAIALVMIGFSGGIAYTKASVRLESNSDNKTLIEDKKRAALAWGIYLASIVVITVVLEFAYSTERWYITTVRVIVILALTFGLEVSSSILNATRIVEEETREQLAQTDQTSYQRKLEIEKMKQETSLKRTALRHGQAVTGITAYAAETVNVASGASLAPDKNIRLSVSSVSSDWRKAEGQLSKNDLLALRYAPIDAIMSLAGISKRTAQRWQNEYIPQAIGKAKK